MPSLPFPEWLPDLPQMNGLGSPYIRNCVPQTAQSYGPMPRPQSYSTGPINARCQGSYSLKAPDGNASIFAGDATKLYRIAPGSTSFTDISGAVYTTPTVAAGGHWSMISFGNRVVATNGTDPIQSFLVGTDTLFSVLSVDAPVAKFAATVKDWLMVGNTTDSDGTLPFRVRWSAIGDPTTWPTPGTDTAAQLLSDYQDLQQTDLGAITGMLGGYLASADAAIFMERGVYRVQATGTSSIFAFAVAQGAAGTRSPLSIVPARLRTTAGIPGVCFYLGEDGFYAFDGAQAIPIGAQKFDRAFFAELDYTYLPYVQAAADPNLKLIYFAFSATGGAGLFNRLLVYNWDLNRATICELETSVEWMTRAIYGTGYTLEQLDAFGTMDTLPASLDDPIWTGGQLALSVFNTVHQLNVLTGTPLGAVLETSETQLFPERRTRINNARPLTDAPATGTVSIGCREALNAPVVYQAAVPINVYGECPQRVTGRYVRLRLTLPVGTVFSHIQGIDVQARPESPRR